MKKAALYARVSSDLQKKEKTIDSQILELKRQILGTGDVLVKEYIDDGFSGARLDRPAMDQLRKDLKTGIFEVIYFLNTDRIAREVTYQTIIIAEILKYKKQIIINGKDYVHNPENKFTLTVLGAVAELERAKIIERVVRGKDLKLAQGHHSGRGCNIFGYDFVHKTPTTLSASLKINEREANVVKIVFNEYTKGEVGINQLTRKLEEDGHLTKTGKKLWRTSILKNMLKNHAYIGTMYFNKRTVSKEYANPLYGTTKTSIRYVHQDRSEWIGVQVPPIISKELFDKAQERLEWNRKKYRNPKTVQLLSNLIRCGECGSSYFAYRTYFKRPLKNNPENVYLRAAYMCNWRFRARMHSLKNGMARCHNKQVTTEILEGKIWDMAQTTMLDPEELRTKIAVLQGKQQNAQLRLRRQLAKVEKNILISSQKKKRVVELYAAGDLDRESYVKRSQEYDEEIKTNGLEKLEIIKRIPVLYKEHIIDFSIKQYCENIRLRFEKCIDFQSKRNFLLNFVDRIIHESNRVTLYGLIPIGDNDEKLEFKIERNITSSDRRRKRLLLHGY